MEASFEQHTMTKDARHVQTCHGDSLYFSKQKIKRNKREGEKTKHKQGEKSLKFQQTFLSIQGINTATYSRTLFSQGLACQQAVYKMETSELRSEKHTMGDCCTTFSREFSA
jgi:hypothetical protein